MNIMVFPPSSTINYIFLLKCLPLPLMPSLRAISITKAAELDLLTAIVAMAARFRLWLTHAHALFVL